MQNSKLTGILKTFSPEELEEFGVYLRSELFKANKNVYTLYICIKKELSGKELKKEDIYHKVFQKEKYDDKKMRYLLTDLTEYVENYLGFVAFRNDEPLRQNLLRKELAKRNCEKGYLQLYNENSRRQQQIKDSDYYYHQYFAEHTHLFYQNEKQQRKEKNNMESVVGYLDKFYLSKKLQLCCEIFNVQNVLSQNYKVFLLEEILSYLRNHSYKDTPIIAIYYQILMTLIESENEEHFRRLKDLLMEHGEQFSLSELRDMYQFILNYCIKKINLGNINYQKELFEIYKVVLGNKVLLVNDHISQWDYKNIVTISFRLKEFEWAKTFIFDYKKFLLPNERENAYTYNLAYWYFHNKDYSKALNMLQMVNFTDIYYQLDTRAIILKIYFELADEEALFYHVSAFRSFLKRNKTISEYQHIIYSNLIKFVSKIVRAGKKKKKIEELKSEISNTKQIADIQWLQQKTEDLLKEQS